MTKKSVLFIGIIGSVLLFLPAILNRIVPCDQSGLFFCRSSYGIIALSALALFPTLLLSLLTYRMKDVVFRAWWNFARWWVPVIIAVTLLLENAPGGGGVGIGGSVQSTFTFLILLILYTVLIIVSLVKIVRAYIRSKAPSNETNG